MNKVLSCMLVLVLMLSIKSVAIGESFKLSELENSSLYNYSKFDKSWKVIAEYQKVYRDVIIDLKVFLSTYYIEKGMGPDMRVTFYDRENAYYNQVNEIVMYIDGTFYTFADLSHDGEQHYVFGGHTMHEMLNALADAKEVAMQISYTNKNGTGYTATIDPILKNELSELIEVARLLEVANVWDTSVSPNVIVNDYYYGASISD